MDKWIQYLNEARDQRPEPEPTPFKSKAQKQYKSLRRKNDIYSTTAGHKNLKSGAPFNNKTKRAGTDNLRFEEVEPESFEKHSELNPKFWQDGKLKEKIRRRLTKIVYDFIESVQLGEDMRVEDIRLTGSLANYNWSKYSDIDLHIVIDFSKIDENTELVEQFFYGSIWRWNELHDIKIYGHEVEIFVENVGHVTHSAGIYSIMNEEWVIEPNPEKIEFDYMAARKKADAIETETNMIAQMANGNPRTAIKSIDRLKKKIKTLRRAGLNSPAQEYSSENIAFKILRREDTLQQLNDMKYDMYDKILSMVE